MKISKERVKKIKSIKDENIDYSEIPGLTEYFWDNAKPIYSNGKKAISIRLDNDIIDFFKEEGKGYQSKINSVLKSYVKAHHHS